MSQHVPRVTVAFVPREQVSSTERCLETLITRTEEPYDLVVIDGGSPPAVKQYLQDVASKHKFTLVRTEEYLTPNQARNLALPHVKTEHVVFVDNDVLVSPGWLKALVDCAERTGAWVVGPLYFEFEPEGKRIHMFGGEVDIKDDGSGETTYVETHFHAHELISDVDLDLRSQRTDLIEFHTVLVQMKVFEKLGPLDEGFLSNSEHGDLCLSVRGAGGQIWLEPDSQITYAPPKSLSGADREFFLLRWSEAWSIASRRHMCEKYAINLKSRGMKHAARWQSQHRRYSMPWVYRWKRRLGRVLGSRFEKSLVVPLEKLWNRCQYPHAKYGHLQNPTTTITRPTEYEKVNKAA